MKNILLLTPFFAPNVGGVETRLSDLCDELDKTGHSVTVLTYQPIITKTRGLPLERRGNIAIHRFWWIGFDLFHKLKPFPLLQTLYICPGLFFWSIIYLLKRTKRINVIHTAGFNAALIGMVLKFIFKKRWIVSTHAIYGLRKGCLSAYMLRLILGPADKILTLSEPSRQELIEIGITAKKLVNQITWVNQSIFAPLDRMVCKERIGHKDSFLILFVGRLLSIKGIEDLVAVAKETSFLDYLFIGEGPLKAFLENEAKASKNISFLPGVKNRDLPIYYNAADIFIMPSQYKEGLGRVAVEALACGTPVIASNLGGIAPLLDSSVAMLIEPTKESIKSSILHLYRRPAELGKMRNACRSFAQEKFSSRNFQVIAGAYNLN